MKDSFFKLPLKYVPLDLEGIGTVQVRELTAAELTRIGKLHEQGKQLEMLTAYTIAAVCDDDLKPIFTNADAERIAQIPMRILNLVAEAANQFSPVEKKSTEP